MPIETQNADGSLNANGYAIHLAHDLVGEGFDGTGYNPIDAALTLAEFVVRITGQPQRADDCSNMQGFECDCGAEGYDAGSMT